MTDSALRIQSVTRDGLGPVRGVTPFWGWAKKAWKWTKDHVVGGAKWIGVKFRF
jgi:hypothetical protein